MNILLIGSSGRIGSDLAIYMLDMGYNLALGDIDTKPIRNKIESLNLNENERVFIKDIDMCSESQYEIWLEEANNFLGSIDGAINCSYPRGKNYGASLRDVNLESFNNNVSLHLGSYFNFLNQTSAFMQKAKLNGSLICTSSIYGHMAPNFDIYNGTQMTMPVEYAAVKSSINHLIKYFAQFYSDTGLRFNSISPGGILDKQPESFINAYAEHSLSKGLLDTSDILPLIEFMISDKSKYINGQNIVIDDGFSL